MSNSTHPVASTAASPTAAFNTSSYSPPSVSNNLTTGTVYLNTDNQALPHVGPALYSLIGMAVCIAATLALCLWMYFCYFPGGRRRRDVIDIGELPKYILSGRVPVDEDDGTEEGQSDYGTQSEADNSFYESVSRDQLRPKSALRQTS